MRMRVIWAMAAVVGSGLVQAHNELPRSTWCQHGHPVEVAQFRFPAATLIEARQAELECQPGPGRTCGQFDDDYGTGQRLALATCGVYDTSAGASDLGSVIYLIDEPASFNDEANHHQIYTVEQGLRGSCIRCQTIERLPQLLIRP